ncbi:hypothetical protein WA026_023635 [Henosepilachna vigintioctopunctata]|uniref:Uncharacterized protein n=1 Tax=Henosepilachna vigintioctopunctata TaxID=420089 RepID=A0AAW1UGX2_9CUCU
MEINLYDGIIIWHTAQRKCASSLFLSSQRQRCDRDGAGEIHAFFVRPSRRRTLIRKNIKEYQVFEPPY